VNHPEPPHSSLPSSRRLQPLLLLIGFTATVAQVLLIRELLVVFYGNEVSLGLFLASWLWWTGTGSFAFGLKAAQRADLRRTTAALQISLAVVLPLTIVAVRSAKTPFITVPGEMLGPWPMLLVALVVLCPFCACSGGLFSAASRLVAAECDASPAAATGTVYLLEAVGSGIGGVMASLMLVREFTSFQIALAVASLNLLSAVCLVFRRPAWRRVACIAVIVAFVAGLLPFAAPRLERLSLGILWRGFHLLASRNSAYGNLAVVETEGNRTLLENGLVLFTVPDPQVAEESVHFALLQHPGPKRLLLIGGGLNGSAIEPAKHPSIESIDVVELDPKFFEIGQAYFSGQMKSLQQNSKVHLHVSDGRLFLKMTSDQYDVIIINLPEPQTAQINRFYTVEFFREAAARMNEHGVLSFQLPASENYVTPARASFLRSINRSLREVFPDIATIPGDTMHFFAARQEGALTGKADVLLQRLSSRHLETEYVREYYLPFRMAPDRMAELEREIRPSADTPVNRDFAPVAYYFDVALWSTQFNQHYLDVFSGMARVKFAWVTLVLAVLIVTSVVFPAFARLTSLARASLAGSVGAMGFTVMALEVLLLLGFQAIYGYVYQQLALLVAAVMAGMALGAWLGLRQMRAVKMRTIAALQLAAAIAPLLLYEAFVVCARASGRGQFLVIAYLVFPLLAVLCGMLGGYQFPLASSLFFQGRDMGRPNQGILYAVDLLGACAGALLLSAYLVPVFGFLKTALLILAVDLAVALLSITAASGEQRSRA